MKDRNPKNNSSFQQQWRWWPLLPLYPYGLKRTLFKELIPNQVWSFEQLQGLYYVAVPVRLTVARVPGGLMLFNPLPPTRELLKGLRELEKKFGPVLTIVLPTASGLEHKISMPAMARAFPQSELWICPGQWSFPIPLPLNWLGFSKRRTKVLDEDGFPHEESCKWISLGPIDIGLGRFQEISCFHIPSKALLVTDALVGISADPPLLFDFDPTPLLFHARDSGDQPLDDSTELRKKGWSRLVLFASFLRPEKLSIPPINKILKDSFAKGLRNQRSHYGLFPFVWEEGWEDSANSLIGKDKPLLQIPPVLKRLVFPRSKEAFLIWLERLSSINDMRWLISAHYEAPLVFNTRKCKELKKLISKSLWNNSEGDWKFLNALDNALLKRGVVPYDPLEPFRD